MNSEKLVKYLKYFLIYFNILKYFYYIYNNRLIYEKKERIHGNKVSIYDFGGFSKNFHSFNHFLII